MLVDSVADVSQHILLESDGLEFDLVFHLLLAELELLGPAMIQ